MKIGMSGYWMQYVIGDKSVNRITFYGNGKIYHTCSGYLRSHIEKNDQDVEWIEIDEPKRRIKENLNLSENYYVPNREGCYKSSDPSNLHLYIYLDKAPGVLERVENGEYAVNKKKYLVISMVHGVRFTVYDVETDSFSREVKEKQELLLYSAMEETPTEKSVLVKELDGILRQNGIEVSESVVRKLHERFILTPREGSS